MKKICLVIATALCAVLLPSLLAQAPRPPVDQFKKLGDVNWGAISDGQFLKRSGNAIIGATGGGGGVSLFTDLDFTASNFNEIETRNFSDLQNIPTTIAGYGITDAQALDSDLTAIAALTTTSFGRGALTQADAAAFRSYIGAGTSSFDGTFGSLTGKPTTLAGYGITDAQPLDSDLTSIAALTTTSFGRSFLDRADAAAARTLLGLGTLATQNGTFSGTSSGTNTGDQTITLTGDVTGSGTGSFVATLANIPDLTPAVGSILHTNIAAPTTPAVGKTKVYVDSTSKNVAAKNDAGIVNHGVQTRTATANNWIRSIADDGSSTISQPAFSDISGTLDLGGAQASGTLAAAREPAHTGDVTNSVGSLALSLVAGNAGNLNSGTLLAARMPALTGDVTTSAGSVATTLAAGNAGNLNSGTLLAARMPALTGDVTTSVGSVATTIASGAVTFAKSNFPVGKTLHVDGTNGNDGTGLRGRFDKPFLTISAAIAAASSGDVIRVGPGTFTENSGVQLPNDVDLIGMGRDVSTISSSLSLSSNKAILAPGNNSFISSLSVHGTAASVAPFGLGTSNTNATGTIIVQDCAFDSNSGGSDAIYLNFGGASGTFLFYRVKALSGGDTILSVSPALIEAHDCELISDGSSGSQSNGIKNNSGNPVRVFGGTVSGDDNSILNSGTTELYGTKIIPGTGSPYFDLSSSGGVGINYSGVVRSDGKALATNGTVTNLDPAGGKISKTSTTDQTATTETAHLTFTVPANFVQPGTTFRIAAWGNMDNPVTTAITFIPRIRWGGTGGVQLLAAPAVVGSVTANTNKSWKYEGYVTIRTTGATGTAVAAAGLENHTAVSNTYGSDEADSGATAVTIDTTASKDLVLSWTLSATTGTPHVRTIGGVVEVVKP